MDLKKEKQSKALPVSVSLMSESFFIGKWELKLGQ